jgi:parallel beta-helix repeat protein
MILRESGKSLISWRGDAVQGNGGYCISEIKGEVKLQKGNGAIKILPVSLVFVLILGYIAILISISPAPGVSAHISYTSHTTISINGDLDFPTQATAESWSGDGTSGNPYIIQGYDINASSASTHGIYIRNTTAFFAIENCFVHHTYSHAGIFLLNCSNGMVNNNTCLVNYWGIYIQDSSDINLTNNICDSNTYEGIFIELSRDNTICNNSCSNNSIGILLDLSTYNLVSNNSCWSNTLSGIIPNLSSNNTINGNSCKLNDMGMEFYQSGANIVSNNNCSDNSKGMHFWSICNDNSIIGNLFENNSDYGIWIQYGSYNLLRNNSFIRNHGANSSYYPAHVQAYDDGTNNYWSSSGYGNYWSDWTTPDIVAPFGIVDNPYNISGSAGAKDYYPLVKLGANLYPMTTASLSGTLGLNGWYRSSVTVTLHATASGGGVNATFYHISTSGSWLKYSSSFVLSNDGISTVQFYSMDNASNNESVKSTAIKIDTKSPTTHATVTGSSVTLSASDNVSGVNCTKYRVDSGTWLNYSGAFQVAAAGNHTIEFYSIDNAGNNESMKTTWVSNGGGGGLGSIFDQYGIPIIGFIIAIIVVIAVYHALSSKGKDSKGKENE